MASLLDNKPQLYVESFQNPSLSLGSAASVNLETFDINRIDI